MMQFVGGDMGMRRALAATTAVATGTAMWEAGELSVREYVGVVQLGSRIFEGEIEVVEGMRLMMGLLMVEGNGRGQMAG